MPDGAGGLEGRERPSKGLQRKDATVGGASERSAELATSVLKRHRGEAPVEDSVSQGQPDLRNAVLSAFTMVRPAQPERLLRRRTAGHPGDSGTKGFPR